MVKVKKVCCGFGHREVFENISGQIEEAVLAAIKNGCEIFYTGAMGEFDRLYSSAIRKVKHTHPHIKLICIKPYFTNDINTDRNYYSAMSDDVIIPDELAGIHYKAAIKARNHWIIDNSDIVIVYTIRDHGGAYDAQLYAEKNSKKIIYINGRK